MTGWDGKGWDEKSHVSSVCLYLEACDCVREVLATEAVAAAAVISATAAAVASTELIVCGIQ